MQHSEFGRPVLSTETIRKMDREELEEQLNEIGAPIREEEPDDSPGYHDDRQRDDLMSALAARGDE